MWKLLAEAGKGNDNYETIAINGFPHGLNTYVPNFRIAQTEASALINWAIRKGGKLVTRTPISVYSNSATTSNGIIDTIAEVNIGGTNYILLVDENYVLYYLDGSLDPTEIGDLEGATRIIGYNGVALLLDGDYIKYLDGVASIKIAYDAGSGSSGFQFDFTALDNDGSLQLGDGTNTRIGQMFTTQAWTAGYTIPPVTVSAYLTKEGAPTGSITVKIYKVSDDSVIATKTFLSDVSELDATTAAKYSATFASTDITNEMLPSTAYYFSLEHTGGDADNCVHVHYNTVTTGGKLFHYAGAWTENTTKNGLMSLSPGRPPKGGFGAIWNNRPFVSGDPDNPGYIWYGNLTHLDWSTSDGGGYLSAVDDKNTNYDVGGLIAQFGDLYAFGTQSQPYMVKISGASPSAYVQNFLFQKPWTDHKTLVSSVNDIWYGCSDGVAPVSGVTEYGDLRTNFASDPILDRIEDYYNDSIYVFAEYYPKDGQYWFVMDAYHRVLIFHTKLGVLSPESVGIRHPISEYEFYRRELTSSDYKWTLSKNGDNEYYLTTAAGADPAFDVQPDFISMDGAVLTEGTAGSLSDHEWDYGDMDLLGYSTVYVRDESGDPDTSGVVIREIMVPSALASTTAGFLLGGSDGYVYYLDSSVYKDLNTIQILPKCATSYLEIPFGYANFEEMQVMASSRGGGEMDIRFYVDGKRVTETVTQSLDVDDGLTVDEAIMDVDDAYFSVDIGQNEMFNYINFNGRSIMSVFSNVTLSGYPIYLNGILIKYRSIGR